MTNARSEHGFGFTGRIWVVLLTVVINIGGVSLLTLMPSSNWRTGLWLNIIDNSLLVGYALLQRDRLLGRLLLFGLVVGVAELPADAWLVSYTKTLDYSVGGGPMLWHSPAWMPLAWEIVAVQFGYIGLRLWEAFGRTGLLLVAFLGAINIPFYEQMARQIHWWRYRECRMLSFTPWYIIIGEFGIALLLALLAKSLRRGSVRTAVVAGLCGGAGIFVSYFVAYFLTDRIIPA